MSRTHLSLVLAAALLAGCSSTEVLTRGHVMSEDLIGQVKVGQTQDQVLAVLGTPSSIATVNGDVFYYISQKHERAFLFMQPKLVDQKVLAVYFDKTKKAQRVANYGIQDGVVFDFITRTTEAGGKEAGLLRGIFEGAQN